MAIGPTDTTASVTINGQVSPITLADLTLETWSPAPVTDQGGAVNYSGSASQVITVWPIISDADYPAGNCIQNFNDGSGPELVGPWAIAQGFGQDAFYIAEPFRVYKWTATHDYNGDGNSDILWRDTSGNVALWSMNGSRVSSSLSLGKVATAWSIAGQRDFDGNGHADLLWRDSSGNVAVWFTNGVTVSSRAPLGKVPTTWAVAGTGDFNGDSYGDILWRNSSTGAVAIWLMNGPTVLHAGSLGTVPNTWQIVGTGDFNADSQDDILWRDSNGAVSIWLLSCLNGTTVQPFVHVLKSVTLGTVPINWTVAGTGDFNGDGFVDILWRDSNTGAVAIWLMHHAQVHQSVSLGTVPNNWQIVGTGDYNNDGTTDILWRDSNTGALTTWLMKPNAQVLSKATVAVVPAKWTVQSRNSD